MNLLRTCKPLEPEFLAAIRDLGACLSQLGIPWFLVGAYAREILLSHVYGERSGRLTTDADFAVAVKGWGDFEEVKKRLAIHHGFRIDERAKQRLYSPLNLTVDLVPFGSHIEEPLGAISWPPEMTTIMSVVGYQESLAHTQSIELSEDLVIQVASIPCLVALKCLAWKERHTRPDGNKDAVDVWTLLSAYERTPPSNFDLIYERHLAILESAEFNTDLAIAWLLGHDIRNSLDFSSVDQLRSMLGSEKLLLTFARHMTQNQLHDESHAEGVVMRLKWLERGLGDS